MNTSIVLTVIADDQPGIIETVSNVLNKHDGNWTQSSMSSLAGQFAGILLASVPGDNTNACLAELKALEAEGLRIIVRTSSDETLAENMEEYSLELVGNDRPGIVHDITRILASHKASVINFETSVEAASMGGGELFKARAQLLVPESSDIFALEGELEDIANDLMVDIRFEK
jgi:glycine cleavage system regulatory protein